MDTLFDDSNNKFYPENQEGHIEYKWRLDTKNNLGHKKLLTQLMWRINEGYEMYGEKKAGYLLGVYDNGNLGKLTVDELVKSINVLKDITQKADLILKEEIIKNINDSYVYYCEIIKNENKLTYKEKHLVIIGESQTGKTTLISQLCYNSNHKKFILKHEHEKNIGITTDIKKEIIGIRNNNIINYCDYSQWNDIAENSDVIINIYDIPVLNNKTIITYLLSINPDYIIICLKDEKNNITFYESFCLFYKIPFIKINMIDIINYNKDFFNNILLNISNYSDKNIIKQTNIKIFNVIDYYDIPEKGLIVSGIVHSDKINEKDILYLHSNNDTSEIKIESIYKKTIQSEYIEQNESGSINITFINKPLKITKHAYITNHKNLNSTNQYEFISNKEIKNGEYVAIVFNGNTYNNINIQIENNIIIFDKNIDILDNKIILSINNNLLLNDMYLILFNNIFN